MSSLIQTKNVRKSVNELKNGMEGLLKSVKNGLLISGTLSSPRKKETPTLKLSIRPVVIKKKNLYQISKYSKSQVTHCNITPEECVHLIEGAIPNLFQQGIFTSSSTYYHILVNKNEQMTIVEKNIETKPAKKEHNRTKNYLFQEGIPVPFLISLGIMNDNGTIIAKKYDKFRQINRFIEMVDDVISHLPINDSKPLEVVDFGCGKASLTFALYHYFTHIKGKTVHITGLDLKKEVIEKCQALADALGYTTLKFLIGDISQHEHQGKIDLVISLHACNTATDAAIDKAVDWNAEVILCVPCCQQELYNQVHNPSLDTLLRHGILKERFAAIATDALRAELLTTLGYDVQVLEFIDMEHTPKNLLIRAVKGNSEAQRQQAQKRLLSFKKELFHKF